jgi:hypothetical protein
LNFQALTLGFFSWQQFLGLANPLPNEMLRWCWAGRNSFAQYFVLFEAKTDGATSPKLLATWPLPALLSLCRLLWFRYLYNNRTNLGDYHRKIGEF